MKVVAAIVELERGVRRLDSNLSDPAALISIDGLDSVLHWTRSALLANDVKDITYIGGYHIEKILDQFPDIRVRYETDWEGGGDLRAMRDLTSLNADAYLIVRSDVVFTADAIRALMNSPSGHVAGRLNGVEAPPVAAAFVSLPRLLDLANAAPHYEEGVRPAGIELFADGARTVDLSGSAASIQNRAQLVEVLFRGKAKTLSQLSGVVSTLSVIEQVRFSVRDWYGQTDRILADIQRRFGNSTVIVRSSAAAEDQKRASLAGHFISVQNVSSRDANELAQSIEKVIRSYSRDGRSPNPNDEVFVQPQVTDLTASGVMFTRDLTTRAPYFVISLEQGSGRSDIVTAGGAGETETHYVSWAAQEAQLADNVSRATQAGRELISLTGLDALDVELAFGADQKGYLFQARPLTDGLHPTCADSDLLETLKEASQFVAAKLARSPGLHGSSTVFSNMADWNPAEMLGPAPRPLALSIYQTIIGQDVWATARAMLGYRDATPNPLVLSIAGRPYVDVRASLNSFLPVGLDAGISEKWVDACLAFLRAHPALHDKIEFEIIPTCFASDWDKYQARMIEAGLTGDDIKRYRQSLLRLTGEVVSERRGNIDTLLSQLDILAERRAEIELCTSRDPADRAFRLLHDCRKYGTLPFAMLARYAFIGMALLRSLHASKEDGVDETGALGRVRTIVDDIVTDIDAVRAGQLSRDVFLARYGHLRPDSYEITSPNYAEAQDVILGGGNSSARRKPRPDIAADPFDQHRQEFDAYCDALDCGINSDGLRSFIIRAMAARELAKFEFMKSLDAILGEIIAFGRTVGLDREELSYLMIDDILQYATNSRSNAVLTRLKRLVGYRRKRWAITSAIRLPDCLSSPDQIFAFKHESSKPNFVTLQSVSGELVHLKGGYSRSDLAGKIVLISSADPGYDWIFTRGIAGLVTQYGGLGSHMAVRAAELQLPAVIGVGEAQFSTLASSGSISIDCARQIIACR